MAGIENLVASPGIVMCQIGEMMHWFDDVHGDGVPPVEIRLAERVGVELGARAGFATGVDLPDDRGAGSSPLEVITGEPEV